MNTMEKYEQYLEKGTEMAIMYAPKLALALLVLIVGFIIIGRIITFISKMMDRSKLDKDVQPFLKSLISVSLKVLLIFSVAGIVGIETTSFVAVLAAAGFAVGMALQGSLSNFASGVMILIFKPYKVGDLIEINEEVGHVKEIQIFNTIIETLDSVTVIIPNSMVVGDKIKNYTTVGSRRIDLNVYMPYEEDFPKVQSIIKDALKKTPNVLNSPEPFVGIETYDTHSLVLAVRPYAQTEYYWDVYFDAYKNVKAALHKHGIKVAYSEGVELGKIGS